MRKVSVNASKKQHKLLQKEDGGIKEVLTLVLRLGLLFQTALGICWVLGNWNVLQPFGESYAYLEAANDLEFGGKYGLIYPFLLRGLMALATLLHSPVYPILYGVQLIMAWWGSLVFCKGYGIGSPKVCALFLCTVPMLLQYHMAVLPDSMALSLLLLLLGLGAQGYSIQAESPQLPTVSTRRWVSLGIWLCLLFLLPVYGLLALPGLWCCVRRDWRREVSKKKRYMCILSLILTLGIGCGIAWWCDMLPKYPGKELAQTVLARCSWPVLDKTYPYWGEELWEAVPPVRAGEIALNRGGIQEELEPMLTAAFGEKMAGQYLWKIAKLTFAYHSREIAIQTGQDLLSCVLPPVGLAWQLGGRAYASCGGRNYEIMKTATPGLTKMVVLYGNAWFAAGVLIAVILKINLGKITKMNQAGILLGITALMVLGYGISAGAGIMDGKRVLFITVLWTALICKAAWDRLENGKQRESEP